MGNKPSYETRDIADRLEQHVGKIALSGRYHKLPKKLDDDYDVQEKVLGWGYNGVVRLATNKAKNQKFAVKAFKTANINADVKAQLESEVEIVLSMDHPHIIRLFAVYESDEFLHLVMECMEGGELFDRVMMRKRFTERDAAEAVWQMLLSINYLHSHDIVHRDLKLENFLYETESSDHLKLIDFGFSKVWDPNVKMAVCCGTLSYVAPEVLNKSYTSQCDIWSLGIVCFILLAGYMPFSGAGATQMRNIQEGKYVMKPEKWNNISMEGKEFTKALLQVDPNKRLTAQAALEHAWISKRQSKDSEVDLQVVDALRNFGQASKFKRACMEMMAWSLSNEERAKVRQYFISMDQNKHGTITLAKLKKILQEKFHVPDAETLQIFYALDSNNDDEIHYSDFLAAMVNTRIAMHEDLLREAFNKFDTDNSGYITAENLRQVLGDSYEGEQVEQLVAEADVLKDNRISYAEFVAYIKCQPLEVHADAAAKIVDNQLKTGSNDRTAARSAGQGAPGILKLKSDAANAPAAPATTPVTDSANVLKLRVRWGENLTNQFPLYVKLKVEGSQQKTSPCLSLKAWQNKDGATSEDGAKRQGVSWEEDLTLNLKTPITAGTSVPVQVEVKRIAKVHRNEVLGQGKVNVNYGNVVLGEGEGEANVFYDGGEQQCKLRLPVFGELHLIYEPTDKLVRGKARKWPWDRL